MPGVHGERETARQGGPGMPPAVRRKHTFIRNLGSIALTGDLNEFRVSQLTSMAGFRARIATIFLNPMVDEN
jgi:hypothetical protein